jgi:hypothetical protein
MVNNSTKYQPNYLLLQTIKYKNDTTYDVGNPGTGLG